MAPCPVKSHKRGLGLKSCGVVLGGVHIRPGDWVYADQDGVLVSKEPLTL